jgi:hypothetical protein
MSWGITPQVEGVFVPTARGSDVIMSVSWPESAKWTLALQGTGAFVLFVMAAGPSLWHVLIAVGVGTLLGASFGIVKTAFHGEHAARVVSRIFG